ncbi:hypothetical protein [Deinococcus multiflagellatus]|uniref:PH domain-containing protein n=1 Tax=Deinococcus multiflagellatus TaxID=1656887 RepID=A0ABW1ZG97_9DEIO
MFSTRAAMIVVSVLSACGLWAVLTGMFSGWQTWVILAAALYMPVVVWTSAQLLRHPPQLSDEGLTFYEHDPLAYVATRRTLQWADLSRAVFTQGHPYRRVVFEREGAESIRFTTSVLTNEEAFRTRLRKRLKANGVRVTSA